MNKSILVTGKDGQLGQSIEKISLEYSQFNFTFVGRDQLNLSNNKSILDFFTDKKFDVIINCAAYTAVDQAESEPELADQINNLAVKCLAEIAKQQDAVFVHISTDYVFDGKKYLPYIEEDLTNPKNVYGKSKLEGERAVVDVNPKGAIIRTSWVYSEYGNNFVKTMLRFGKERNKLNVIFDQIGSPTYAVDLAKAILAVVSQPEINDSTLSTKILHYSNEGVCSWFDFAKAIFDLSEINCAVYAIDTKDYPTPAQRPHYSLMNKSKIKKDYDINIPYWRDALQVCLKNLES